MGHIAIGWVVLSNKKDEGGTSGQGWQWRIRRRRGRQVGAVQGGRAVIRIGVMVYTEEGEGFGRCRGGEVGSPEGGDYGGGRCMMVESGPRDRIFKGVRENGGDNIDVGEKMGW